MIKMVKAGVLTLLVTGLICGLVGLQGDDMTTSAGSSANPNAQPTSDFAGFTDALFMPSDPVPTGQLGVLSDPDNGQQTATKTEYGSTVSITGPVKIAPNVDYNIILSATTSAPIYQWYFYEDGIYLTGKGFVWGSAFNRTFTFNKPAEGSHTYLLRFRGIEGAHGWPPFTAVSIIVTIAPSLQPPNAPSNLTARTISSSRIDLEWLDNSNNETGFRVERKTGLYGTYEPIAYVSTISPDAGTAIPVWFSDENLSPDTSYTYRVCAYNDAGPSNYTPEMTALTLLSTPTDLVAQPISISQINLTWHDNSLTEEGFVIERQVDYGPFIPVATVGTNAVNYSDTGLASYTQYKYRIKAVRTGNWSDYSGETTTETYRVTGAYISNLINQYVRDGSIDNPGVAEALQSKLTAAEDSLARGNLTAYRNQLTAFRNYTQAQGGQHIAVNAAGLLFQFAGQIQNLQSEIRGAKLTIAPSPYIPEGQVITFTAIITPSTATGNYKWTVSPAGSAKIELVGDPEGTTAVTPTIGVKGLKASDKLDDVGLNFVFTETVKGKAIVTTTAAWKFTVIATSVTVITYTVGPSNVFEHENILFTAIHGEIDITSTATISTTPASNEYASQWVLGYIQNVTSTDLFVTAYNDRVVTDTSLFLPILDSAISSTPLYDIGIPFTDTNQSATAKFHDFPGAGKLWHDPITNTQNNLIAIHYTNKFILWLVAYNKATHQIIYLRWWIWQVNADYIYTYTEPIGTRGNELTKEVKILNEGVGVGPFVPIITPPLANDSIITTKDPP